MQRICHLLAQMHSYSAADERRALDPEGAAPRCCTCRGRKCTKCRADSRERFVRPAGFTLLKHGAEEGSGGERFFNRYTEGELHDLGADAGGWESAHVWRTLDVRPGRDGELWISFLVRRYAEPLGSPFSFRLQRGTSVSPVASGSAGSSPSVPIAGKYHDRMVVTFADVALLSALA